MTNKFYPVIGLEIHVELETRSKMFCSCSAKHFGKEPNSQTCPVCLGLPGALPVPNKEAIKRTLFLALALGCQINKNSWFDRKNYFYPDLPKGYQISQFFKPLGVNGKIILQSNKVVKIHEIHLEEDTAKSIHRKVNGKEVTFLDFNKSGIPLIEVVSEPDLTSAQEAKDYAQAIHQLVRRLKISHADMEKGQMRLEANISLKKYLNDPLPPYKVEIKNINSFKFLKDAIDYEINRQQKLLNQEKQIPQETRGYDSKNKKTFIQRSKEKAYEYRYFPEPDIPPLVIDKLFDIESLKKSLPELPEQAINRLINQYHLSLYQAKIITKTHKVLSYFEKAARAGQKQKIKANDIANIIINKKLSINKLSPPQLINKIREREEQALVGGAKLRSVIKKVLIANPKAIGDYKKGKTNALAFLIGQVQKETKGKADIKQAQKMLREKLK
ncbi:Asp-tRNA(Asn)/Glu-tRNA(Gln) amidotransferase GatCAB subunit B [Candidatus Shapirobacteria bacterium CG09_land_8_20_14_0_10_38_17]|uniref:Aspartyl/glutamyl-tRNA(Asn/Gln) amidotransferase subunit B n=1 Tax=Candidatus Shapirobacteria bacterium CG09_land_8_20_14_0_10_38_17 TaxID=1974884 RepID=A0A2H0WRE3_9BACT|nr:MAG: Asp-tRNA(Asn)/Glu-tRNA(Gln) amidotransferase GatCAB subunit B [Candidatus Shapirobacteria bacterium CG09_land_8_20_14_0_10_38_17]